jgi:hypothetical protein
VTVTRDEATSRIGIAPLSEQMEFKSSDPETKPVLGYARIV